MDSSIRIYSVENLQVHYSDLVECSHSSIENNSCPQYPFTFVWRSGHGIVTATNPGMYDYFPVDTEAAKRIQMMGIGFIIVFATPRVRQEVLFWWILCALEEDCMSPPGHTVYVVTIGRKIEEPRTSDVTDTIKQPRTFL